MNKDRPRATLRCPQCGFKVPLGDRQYAELQRRLRVIAICPRCRLTFPYSAVGGRAVGPAAAFTAAQQMFAPTAEGPVVVPALETDVVEEQPYLTIADSDSADQRTPRRSLLAV